MLGGEIAGDCKAVVIDVAQEIQPACQGLPEVKRQFGHAFIGSFVLGLDGLASGESVGEDFREFIVEIDRTFAYPEKKRFGNQRG